MTPSNADTSGPEAWAYRLKDHEEWSVTAAAAQARIAELEALVASYRKTADLEARDCDAAEARADRLAKGLKDAEESARRYARCYEPSSDGRNTFLMLADHIHALQQEG